MNQKMGQNNQKDQKGHKMTTAVIFAQDTPPPKKKLVPPYILENSESAFFLGHPVYMSHSQMLGKFEYGLPAKF